MIRLFSASAHPKLRPVMFRFDFSSINLTCLYCNVGVVVRRNGIQHVFSQKGIQNDKIMKL
jgi:hypothetical protein